MDYRLKNRTERRLYVAFYGAFRQLICRIGYRKAPRGNGFLFEEALEHGIETVLSGMTSDTRIRLDFASSARPKLQYENRLTIDGSFETTVRAEKETA